MENLESVRAIYSANNKLDEKKNKEKKSLIKKKLIKKRLTKIEQESFPVIYNSFGEIDKSNETGKSVDLKS